jgi:hypothetical protein
MADLMAKEPFAAMPVTQYDAKTAFELVLARAGATLPKRDAVDARIVEMTRTGKVTSPGKGIIKDPNQVGGWPVYENGEAPTDSDHDGMPDEWEKRRGLDPNDAADGPADGDGDGYTNLEEYLNSIA